MTSNDDKFKFKPGDPLNPYDPAAVEAGAAGVGERIQAGTSPINDFLSGNEEEKSRKMSALLAMMKHDAAERKRTGETPYEQMMREKREWAEEDARSARLKLQGNEAFKKGNFKSAYVYYTACMIKSGHEPVYHLNRAATALQLRLYEGAIIDADKAIKQGETAKAYFRRGQAHMKLGLWPQADKDFEKALQLQPGDSSLLKAKEELQAAKSLARTEFRKWVEEQGARTEEEVFGRGELARLAGQAFEEERSKDPN